MPTVRVGEVVFNGSGHSGLVLGPDGFKGWDGAAATKRDAAERAGGHGAFDVPAFKVARLVTLSGHAIANSETELEHLGEMLSGLGQSRQNIVVTSSVGSRWGSGSVEGEIKFDRLGDSSVATFQLTLWMPDPFKYGELRRFDSTGDDVKAWHRGNTDALPTFRVAGFGDAGYALYRLGGGTFKVEGPRSGIDEIDFATGRVLRNGEPLIGSLTTSDLWTVPGGNVTMWRVAGLGSSGGSATMYVHDRFV